MNTRAATIAAIQFQEQELKRLRCELKLIDENDQMHKHHGSEPLTLFQCDGETEFYVKTEIKEGRSKVTMYECVGLFEDPLNEEWDDHEVIVKPTKTVLDEKCERWWYGVSDARIEKVLLLDLGNNKYFIVNENRYLKLDIS